MTQLGMVDESNSKKVFLSHTTANQLEAKLVSDVLLQAGLGMSSNDVFLSCRPGKGAESGEPWLGELKQHLKIDQVVIALVSPEFRESKVCLIELGAAIAQNKLIVLSLSLIHI